jgi:hypothetical protein
MSSTDLVKIKGSGRVFVEKEMLKKSIRDSITAIPDVQKLRDDPRLLQFALDLAKNGIHQKVKDKILILDVVLEVFQHLFNLSVPEKDALKKTIEFIIDTDQVHKVSMLKKFKSVASKLAGSFVKG